MFDFNGNARTKPLRPLADRFKKSPLRDEIEINDGLRPGAWYPWKFLPVEWVDINTGEGVVIQKGTIVSVQGPLSSLSTTIGYPNDSGEMAVFIDAVTGVANSGHFENSAFGYEATMGGTMVPANGGYVRYVYNTAGDVTVGTFATDGTVITAAGVSASTIPANKPVGVTYKDVYQDNRGRYLNGSSMGENWNGVLCDGYITVPFVDTTKFNDAAKSGVLWAAGHSFGAAYYTGSANSITTVSGAYPNVRLTHPFMYTISGVAEATGGCFVMSDLFGKFIPQYSGATTFTYAATLASGAAQLSVASGATTLTNTWVSGTLTSTIALPNVRTDQTVGRLMEIDFNYPKHNLQYVDTVPGSSMPGTDTLGLPNALYTFAYDSAYYALGSVAPAKADLLQAVREGVFGMARIQLSVS